MRVRVGKRSQAIIIFLPGSIPECQLDVLSIHFHICDVVLEYGGDVDL